MSGIANSFNGHMDEFRITHVQRSDGWTETTRNNNPGAFAVAGAKEQGEDDVEPPLLAGAGVLVCLMG